MKTNKLLILLIAILILFSCSKGASNNKVEPNKSTQSNFKLSPQQIDNLVKLENNILAKKILLQNVVNNFIFNNEYYVIGKSKKGNAPEMKRASQLDGKRWAAIIMKYLLTGQTGFDLKGEYVDFVSFEGEYFDEQTSILYTIYKFRREK
ncbi:hypothetical protein J7L48_03815 [bacterium]|nr:hypothetical protein [bacterium]